MQLRLSSSTEESTYRDEGTEINFWGHCIYSLLAVYTQRMLPFFSYTPLCESINVKIHVHKV